MPSSPEAGRTARPRLVLIIGVLALALAACSTPGAAPSSAAPQATIESATPPPSPSEASSGGGRGDYDYIEPMATSSAEASAPPAAATSVDVATATGPLGTYLIGAGGLTLYTFKPDSANTSTCDGGCAEAWPPFTIEPGVEFVAGDGVDKPLTTFARSDGTFQVAYDGAPLYYFANDTTAGDTNGQGLGDNWFVAKP
jgi:predicted lipoprotein with Yx(FWY)xxD motif